VKLNLGCGHNKLEGYMNIDCRPEVNPDRILTVPEGLSFYPDNCCDEIVADDFLEHIPIPKIIETMEHIYRILKPDGIFFSSTPDAQHGQGAFQDPTHVSFWVQNSWLYYSDDDHRNLYGIKAKFKIEDMVRREHPGEVFHIMVHAIAIK
jgi:predicted SAM-dependent methyltransferase